MRMDSFFSNMFLPIDNSINYIKTNIKGKSDSLRDLLKDFDQHFQSNSESNYRGMGVDSFFSNMFYQYIFTLGEHKLDL